MKRYKIEYSGKSLDKDSKYIWFYPYSNEIRVLSSWWEKFKWNCLELKWKYYDKEQNWKLRTYKDWFSIEKIWWNSSFKKIIVFWNSYYIKYNNWDVYFWKEGKYKRSLYINNKLYSDDTKWIHYIIWFIF